MSKLKQLSVMVSLTLLAPAVLADEAINLGAVVVTAAGYEQAVADAPASITVIPREELEKRAYPDITEALKDVPGVVVTGGGSSSDISIRGMASKYTMVLIDGKRQNSRETRPNSDGPGIEQGWLPPIQAIERIEVVRGPMSSLYGSDAMGGVINIITRKVAKEWMGSIRLDGTLQEDSDSGNMYNGGFYASGPLVENVLGLTLYGHKSQRQEDRIVSGFNKQETDSGTVKLALTPNQDHDIEFEFGRTLQDRVARLGKSAGSARAANESYYDKNRYAVTHNGRYDFGRSTSYIQREEIENPGREMYLDNTEMNTQWTIPLANHILNVGAYYNEESLKDNGNQFNASVNHLERYQRALFAENEWSITDDFALTAGLRMTDDENYGTHWTPRLYGVWHATDNFSVKGGVSTGFKAPGLREAVADWGQITGGGRLNAVILGNPDLKPEKSVSQEISFVWDNQNDLLTSLTLFNTDFEDKITEVRECNTQAECGGIGFAGYDFVSSRENVDEATMRGVEATATWQFHPHFRLASNYTYTRSEQKSGQFKGEPLNEMPRHMFNTTLDWTPNDVVDVWTRMNFRGKTSEYLSRASMAEGTSSYAFFDAGVQYKVNKNLDLGLAVYNLFDKEVGFENYGIAYDGRRYWAGATLNF